MSINLRKKPISSNPAFSVVLLTLMFALVACTSESQRETATRVTAAPTTISEQTRTESLPEETPTQEANLNSIISTETPAATRKSIPTASQPTATSPVTIPKRIATGTITAVDWSDDSTMIFYYSTPGGWFVYDLLCETTRELSAEELMLMTPQPTVFPDLPTGTTKFSVSPSGKNVLYVIRSDPTPTPLPQVSPEAQGEVWIGGGAAELWLRNDDDSVFLANIENCVQDFIWSKDEEFVVIPAILAPAPCKESYAWLINLRTHELYNLFPREGPSVSVMGISPNGQTLLYKSERSLFILDISTRESRELNIPDGSNGQWLDDNKVLITYQARTDEPFMGIVNLETGHLSEIVGPTTTPVLDKMLFNFQQPSPDRHWLAFAAGSNFYRMEGLWLMKMNDSR